MNIRKSAIYAWRNGVSKQNEPFVVEWSRKLTTKERDMIKANPWAMFKPRDCRIAYRATPSFDA